MTVEAIGGKAALLNLSNKFSNVVDIILESLLHTLAKKRYSSVDSAKNILYIGADNKWLGFLSENIPNKVELYGLSFSDILQELNERSYVLIIVEATDLEVEQYETLVDQLRRIQPTARIIFTSPQPLVKPVVKAFKAGVDDYFPKTRDKHLLREQIVSWFEKLD